MKNNSKINSTSLRLFLLFIFLLLSFCVQVSKVFGTEETHKQIQKTETDKASTKSAKVKIGAYILSLYDFNPDEGKFSADFWLWFNWRGEDVTPMSSFEIVNATNVKYSLENVEDMNGIKWGYKKVSGNFIHNWDVSNFPFDRHKLTIVVEEALKETEDLIYIADTKNTAIDKNLEIDGWQVENVSIEAKEILYDSTFGNPSEESGSAYSRASITISIARNAVALFAKLHAGVYTAIAITLLAFLMPASSDDIFSGRTGIMVGMLFATVINQQSVSSIVGETIALSLSDKIHIASYSLIFIGIGLTLLSRRLCDNDMQQKALLLDKISMFLCLLTYVAINFYFVHSVK